MLRRGFGLINIKRDELEEIFFRKDDDELVLYFVQNGIINVPLDNICPICGQENAFYTHDRLFFKPKFKKGKKKSTQLRCRGYGCNFNVSALKHTYFSGSHKTTKTMIPM